MMQYARQRVVQRVRWPLNVTWYKAFRRHFSRMNYLIICCIITGIAHTVCTCAVQARSVLTMLVASSSSYMTTAACGLRSPLTVPQHYSYSTLQHSVVSELTKHTNLVICIAQSIYFLYNYVPSVIWWLVWSSGNSVGHINKVKLR